MTPPDADSWPDPLTWGPAGPVLGVDLGLRTGTALLADVAGVGLRLRRYGSTHYANRAALRRAAPAVLADAAQLGGAPPLVVVEGDTALARIWGRAAERIGGELRTVPTERWREALLLPRERRRGTDAKRHAGTKARAVVEWSRRDAGAAAPAPPAGELRHDTAEAILIAVHGAVQVGWLDVAELPFAVPGR